MINRESFVDYILKEWLLVVSAAGCILTSLYAWRIPSYSVSEVQVLILLVSMFVTLNGLQGSGFISAIAKSINGKRLVALKLVTLTFFLSMIVTNDIALLVMVPITLSLDVKHRGELVILEALSANAGSAFTPFGNPQNLYIYWSYGVEPSLFLKTIAPFSFSLLFALLALTYILRKRYSVSGDLKEANKYICGKAYTYLSLIVVLLLVLLHKLPFSLCFLVIIYPLIFDRNALKIDYPLILTFFFFFGVAANLRFILKPVLNHPGHIFLSSALASQVMSNVPATLLFAKFTTNWPSLLWGVNAGGFGSLFGSLANLIAYKIYAIQDGMDDLGGFFLKFNIFGYIAFFFSIGLYFIFMRRLEY